MTILLIEDDPAISVMYRIRLQEEGFEVIAAYDGESGVSAAAGSRPDLVLLDYHLPRLNGLQVLRELRARPETATLPVIVLSGNEDPAILHQLRDAGAVECLAKSRTTPSGLVAHVRAVLGLGDRQGQPRGRDSKTA
jgi:two-component system phosphate regulon response regulator PhoB